MANAILPETYICSPDEIDTQVFSRLPTEVLIVLKSVINSELRERNDNLAKTRFVERRLKAISNFKDKHKEVQTQEEEDEYFEEWRRQIEVLNKMNFMEVPHQTMRNRPHGRSRFIYPLSLQNWKHLFPGASDEKKDFYVYCHCDPRARPIYLPKPIDKKTNGLPFYIGKGVGGRAFDLKRNDGHGKMVRDIRRAGFSDDAIVEILAESLTEVEALELEAKLIYLLGSIYDPTVNGCLVNLVTDSLRPKFDGVMPKKPARKIKKPRDEGTTSEVQQ